MVRSRLRIQRTVLLVVEGYADKEFVLYLKSLYHQRGSGFRLALKNARGKGSNNVIDTACGERRQGDYDLVAVFFDADVPLTAKSRRRCRQFERLVAKPCLEGMLLEILDQPVASTCEENKQRYSKYATGRELGELFPKSLLERKRSAIAVLDRLLNLLETGRSQGG